MKKTLREWLNEEILKDQEIMHQELLKNVPDKIRASYFEGSCCALQTTLLIIENSEDIYVDD
jgi:hypothetical protein